MKPHSTDRHNGQFHPVSPEERYKAFQQRGADDFSDVLPVGATPSLKENARVDYTRELPPPAVALKLGNEIFGTLGNFSLVIGKAKSRKTFLIALAMAGAIEPTPPFEGCLPAGKKKVVFVDTEQGEYHVIKVAQRVTRLAGKPRNFEVYALRKFSTEERNMIIEEIINTTPDLGLLVIDGVRDIVTSINDEEQATDLANKLLKWTEEKEIHIATVLHQNEGDVNARGHIGTELINKAETTVSVTVEKDPEVSKVEVEYSRNRAFQPFAFRVNEVGLPEVVEGWQPKSDTNTKKCVPSELDEYKHTQILQKIARNISDRPSYSDVSSQIIEAVTEIEEYIGETKARQFFTHYLNKGFIQKHGKDRSPKAYYSIHPMGGKDE